MAHDTDTSLQHRIIYSVYVRAHTDAGTFHAVAEDLPRIRALGADYIWFMPIHPIGVKGKKGSLGCPYAVRDYRGVNPAYGTTTPRRTRCFWRRTRTGSIAAPTVAPAAASATGRT